MKDILASSSVVCALPLHYASEGLYGVCVSTDTNFLHGSLTFRGGGGGVPFDRDTNKHGQTPFPVILLATSLWISYSKKTVSPEKLRGYDSSAGLGH